MNTKESIKEAKSYGLSKTHVLRLTLKKKANLENKGHKCVDYVAPFGSHQTCISW